MMTNPGAAGAETGAGRTRFQPISFQLIHAMAA
jgi:hypothetical protein